MKHKNRGFIWMIVLVVVLMSCVWTTALSSAGVKCILHKRTVLVIHFYSGKQKKMKGVDWRFGIWWE